MGWEWSDPEDSLLAHSIFGTDDPSKVRHLIDDWMAEQGFGRACVISIAFSVGAGVTLRLDNGTMLFLKVWPGTTDRHALTAQTEVQAAMAAGGFPAPDVIRMPATLGPALAVAMEYNRAGAPTEARNASVRRAMAAGLARFIADAETHRHHPGLPRRSLPHGDSIWPPPHSVLFNFEAEAQGAEWIDEIARRALSVMRYARSRIVVGHHDWSAKNMRMGPDGIAVLYDWDSVFLDHETFTVGSAAAHFPMTWELDVPETPEIGAVAAFVQDYEQARGLPFTHSELAEVEAGATYARTYKARCEHATDPGGVRWHDSSRESLQAHGPFRFDRG